MDEINSEASFSGGRNTMATNRIRRYSPQPRFAMSAQPIKSIAPPTAMVTIPHGFVVCPPQLALANAVQQQIYRLAYQRAQAAVQIPRHHRRMSVWN
jgi:hypothetical protein